ncbi:MAG TPA: sulfite exporter TauE/SafE family protein [Blastocatellia bacterium]|nr:sulfite exporter TauE/SafE family protein [Blastocatellia bacterium]
MTIIQGLLLFGAAMMAGMMNAVAGGGTLVTFPALIWAGRPEIIANATSTVALVPGTWASAYGYRAELLKAPRKFLYLIIPSVAGGLIGAVLLKRTPSTIFAALVPFLILFATILFMLQGPVQRRLRSLTTEHQEATARWMVGAGFYQFLVAIYGGYFGGGIGILMLAVLGLMGLSDIHQMNGLKNILGSATNMVAATFFIFAGMVDWPSAALMAAGAIVGGYGAAGIARKIGQKAVRRIVIVTGFAMTILLMLKRR